MFLPQHRNEGLRDSEGRRLSERGQTGELLHLLQARLPGVRISAMDFGVLHPLSRKGYQVHWPRRWQALHLAQKQGA
jgi:hypothetical protein